MKIRKIEIHNYRSIIDASIEAYDYTMIVGANNAGKSTIINALRAFYDDLKWSQEDFPKVGWQDDESWVTLTFELSVDEWNQLANKYKEGKSRRLLTVRRYFRSNEREIKTNQSNIYAIVNGEPDRDLFYGAKNVGTAKVGSVIYIPALTTPGDQLRTTGPSPFRNMLNFMLKRVVRKSTAFQELSAAFDKLNEEAKGDNGFLSEISSPINRAIADWKVKLDLSVNPVGPDDISKSLVKPIFVDLILDEAFELERHGHGFQRSFIYELIKLAPSFKDAIMPTKKEFDPEFTLILFEEPEAFLHPGQQENMAYHLRRLGEEEGQQVIVTTHSSIFVGKAADEIGQIVRVHRPNGISDVFQPKHEEIQDIFGEGLNLTAALRRFVDDPALPENEKRDAKKMVESAPPQDEIALQEERFRYQLWLDSERASMFFADRVLLVEGSTDKALFNYLLARDWNDLSRFRIVVVDAGGKYNFHRFLALFKAFGIPHGLMIDDDKNKEHHAAVNELIRASMNEFTLSSPFEFHGCLETYLGLTVPKRDDKKPIEILKALTGGHIAPERMKSLRAAFLGALGLEDVDNDLLSRCEREEVLA